jgi:hypothetical protein
MDTTTSTDRLCVSADRCRAYDPITKQPAYVGPAYLCDACLTAATRDVRTLVYDYLDLEQLQIPSLSQAMDTQPRSKAAPPMPLRGEPEALQAEIHHVTTLWADELRRHHRLHNRQRPYLIGAWHTTTSNPAPPPRRLPGAEVQEAVDTLTPRLRDLAALPPRTVFPAGVDDDPEDMTGWQAIHHLQHLRQRARSMLGWTRRVTHLPGTCSGCGQDELRRDEPRYPEDPCDVYCSECGTTWTTAEYDQYVMMLVWPTRTAA